MYINISSRVTGKTTDAIDHIQRWHDEGKTVYVVCESVAMGNHILNICDPNGNMDSGRLIMVTYDGLDVDTIPDDAYVIYDNFDFGESKYIKVSKNGRYYTSPRYTRKVYDKRDKMIELLVANDWIYDTFDNNIRLAANKLINGIFTIDKALYNLDLLRSIHDVSMYQRGDISTTDVVVTFTKYDDDMHTHSLRTLATRLLNTPTEISDFPMIYVSEKLVDKIPDLSMSEPLNVSEHGFAVIKADGMCMFIEDKLKIIFK